MGVAMESEINLPDPLKRAILYNIALVHNSARRKVSNVLKWENIRLFAGYNYIKAVGNNKEERLPFISIDTYYHIYDIMKDHIQYLPSDFVAIVALLSALQQGFYFVGCDKECYAVATFASNNSLTVITTRLPIDIEHKKVNKNISEFVKALRHVSLPDFGSVKPHKIDKFIASIASIFGIRKFKVSYTFGAVVYSAYIQPFSIFIIRKDKRSPLPMIKEYYIDDSGILYTKLDDKIVTIYPNPSFVPRYHIMLIDTIFDDIKQISINDIPRKPPAVNPVSKDNEIKQDNWLFKDIDFGGCRIQLSIYKNKV